MWSHNVWTKVNGPLWSVNSWCSVCSPLHKIIFFLWTGHDHFPQLQKSCKVSFATTASKKTARKPSCVSQHQAVSTKWGTNSKDDPADGPGQSMMMGYQRNCPLRWDIMFEKNLQLHRRHPNIHMGAAGVQFLCLYEDATLSWLQTTLSKLFHQLVGTCRNLALNPNTTRSWKTSAKDE